MHSLYMQSLLCQCLLLATVSMFCTMFSSYNPVCVLLETPFPWWTNNDKKYFLSCKKYATMKY